MIKHITIKTSELERSIVFYENIVGLKIVRDLRDVSGQAIVFMAQDSEDTCIELIENTETAYNGSGISVGFYKENVEDFHKILSGKGLNPTSITSPTPNTSFFFIKDPNGLDIQFIN